MLSMILYGRNDSYGYNLHKRAALSLNCMAEVLDAEGDEILFVDYNTPDDYPTFPEAIRDTLTARARRMLRIFRVRPAQHARFRHLTHLVALEPVARNVALRRSNPENRWILSTNTDMIFVPRDGCSLGEIARGLEDALYHLPRFEIPETLWEGLDRMDPGGTIAEVGRWGWDLHLNEIVYGAATVLYDGPGDFQLAPRADLFRIDGFDEGMLLGWHVDSNLARRCGLLHGPPRTLVGRLFGYHCDHTRQVTPAHRHDRVENDWRRFVDGVSCADIPEQRGCWGLASETIEEIRLDTDAASYVGALRAVIGEPMKNPTEIAYREDSFEKIGYDPRHALPFLVDAVSCYPPAATIGWIGAEAGLLERFVAAWEGLGFTGWVLVPNDAPWLELTPGFRCRRAPFADVARTAAAFVVDFGPNPASETMRSGSSSGVRRILRSVGFSFRRLVVSERQRLENKDALPRRFIAVNAVHSRFESLVRGHIDAAAAPIGTRLRQGFVLPAEKGVRSLLSVLNVGDAGRREGAAVATLAGVEGYVLFGGYRDLMAGGYRLRVRFERPRVADGFAAMDVMMLEVVTGSYYLAFRPITGADIARGEVVLEFAVAEEFLFYLMALRVEFRLLTRGLIDARVVGATLEDLGGDPSERAAAEFEWLPLMVVGNAGGAPAERSHWWRLGRSWPARQRPGEGARATAAGVLAPKGKEGCVVYGPYATLLPGRYLLEVELAPDPADGGIGSLHPEAIRLDVFCLADDEILAEAEVGGRALSGAGGRALDGTTGRIEFTVPDRPDSAGNPMRLEFRVWTSGEAGFMVRAVRTRALAPMPIEDGRPVLPAADAIRVA